MKVLGQSVTQFHVERSGFSLPKSSFMYLNAESGENQPVKRTRILEQADASTSDAAN
jgi:hypothetical protein